MSREQWIEWIKFIQIAQCSSFIDSSISKFDVDFKMSGTRMKCSIWISVKKDRSSSSYFYDVCYDDSMEKAQDVAKRLVDFYKKGLVFMHLSEDVSPVLQWLN